MRALVVFFVVFGFPGLALISGFQSAPGEVFAGDRVTNAAVGSALLAFALYLMRMAWKKATLTVAAHENGLSWHENGRTRVVPWTEIESMRDSHVQRTVVGAEVARTNVYRLRLRSGRELVATSMLTDVHALGEQVASALERRLPDLRDALAKGRAIAFGETTLDAKGIVHAERAVPWTQIASTEVVGGAIEITPHDGAPVSIDWASTPNARLLLALIRENIPAAR